MTYTLTNCDCMACVAYVCRIAMKQNTDRYFQWRRPFIIRLERIDGGSKFMTFIYITLNQIPRSLKKYVAQKLAHLINSYFCLVSDAVRSFKLYLGLLYGCRFRLFSR